MESSINKMREAPVHFVARSGLALVFLYHGVVPKMLYPAADEFAMLRDMGVAAERCQRVMTAVGIAEVLFALALVWFWNCRWPAWFCAGLMVAVTIGVGATSPRYLVAAFNPVSLNLAVGCLAVIDLMVVKRK